MAGAGHPAARLAATRALTDSATQVWAEIVGRADEHAQLAMSYLVFMVAAGVIAGIGVLTASAVLLVGAMAISPDLLPISATAIGIVERRPRLALRAFRVLMVGLGTAALAAFVATVLLRLFGRVPDDLILAETTMGQALTDIGPGAYGGRNRRRGRDARLRTPRGAAVGVAISVTTIPAAAYVGAAIGMGRDDPMWGALVVLLSNVAMLLIARLGHPGAPAAGTSARHPVSPRQSSAGSPVRSPRLPSRVDRLGPRGGVELAVDRLGNGS